MRYEGELFLSKKTHLQNSLKMVMMVTEVFGWLRSSEMPLLMVMGMMSDSSACLQNVSSINAVSSLRESCTVSRIQGAGQGQGFQCFEHQCVYVCVCVKVSTSTLLYIA